MRSLSLVALITAWVGLKSSAESYGDFTYTITNGTVNITDYSISSSTLIFPSEINGLPVTRIASNHGVKYRIYQSITNVVIPSSVTTLGDWVFLGLDLIDINIPASVSHIEELALEDLHALTQFNVDQNNPNYSSQDGVLYNKTKQKLLRYPAKKGGTSFQIPLEVTEIAPHAFQGGELENIAIPSGVVSIWEPNLSGLGRLTTFIVDSNNPNYSSQDGVLYDKTKQKLLRYPAKKSGTSFQIPLEVTEIAPFAFYGSQPENIIIPLGVASIGVGAFINCTNLTSLNIPASVKSVGLSVDGVNGNYAPSLASVNVDEANADFSSQDGVLFNKNKSTLIFYPMSRSGSSYTIPAGVTHVGQCAFAYCHKLSNIAIPQTVTSIGSEAFALSGITNISIPIHVTNIETGAFQGCWSLKTVNLPPNMTTIKSNTFANSDSLKSINIPSNINEIEFGAFQGCRSLSSIELPNGLLSIGEYSFGGCSSLQEITIPSSVSKIADGAFGDCSSLNRIIVSSDNSNFISMDGVLYDRPQSRLIAYPAGKIDPYYSVSMGVSTIGDSAFSGSHWLEIIKIPASVSFVGNFAFGGPNLKAVIFLGSAPEFIGEAFSWAASTGINNSSTTVYHMPGATGWGASYSDRPVAVWALQPPLISNFSTSSLSIQGPSLIQLNHNTSPGIPYRLESSPDMKIWTTISSGWGDGGLREFQEYLPNQPLNSAFGKRFYRLVQENP